MSTEANSSQVTLPEQYRDLEPWATRFAHPSEAERYAVRATADFSELESFYEAMLPRMPSILEELGKHPANDAQPDILRLANLGCAFMDVSLSIEIFKQPIGTEGLDWRRIEILF